MSEEIFSDDYDEWEDYLDNMDDDEWNFFSGAIKKQLDKYNKKLNAIDAKKTKLKRMKKKEIKKLKKLEGKILSTSKDEDEKKYFLQEIAKIYKGQIDIINSLISELTDKTINLLSRFVNLD